ncbi:uncharacterized protein [Macrobrachium rosenbergii]|uniref:uncharacterized protein isoform X2 n=1 Tax=Macrobrachium rosenbergii TaxID=79674 RepID=UPI0034D5A697
MHEFSLTLFVRIWYTAQRMEKIISEKRIRFSSHNRMCKFSSNPTDKNISRYTSQTYEKLKPMRLDPDWWRAHGSKENGCCSEACVCGYQQPCMRYYQILKTSFQAPTISLASMKDKIKLVFSR